MLSIVKNEIEAATGGTIGDLDWDNIINTAITTTPDIINAANSGKQTNTQSNSNGTIVGGDPATVTPGTRPLYPNSSKSTSDYLPWILGGAAVLLLVMMMSNNNKK